MKISAAGIVKIKLTSPDIARTITVLSQSNILLEQVQFLDELTIVCTIKSSCLNALKKFHFKSGETIQILRKQGFFWHFQKFLHRPILIVSVIFFLFLSYYLPAHVYFFRIDGNHQVPSNKIQEAAAHCGLKFGVSARNIYSESLKNAMIGMIPELRWVGITTSGSVATIHVKEGKAAKSKISNNSGITSIVAGCDGIIEEITVLKGNPICKPGQAVRKGQVLISGLTDCGLSISATGARGEVYAKTTHYLSCITPEPRLKRGIFSHVETAYSLIVGKNIIKLWNDSGISTTKCVKMYEEYPMALPGGFSLPVTLLREKRYYYAPCADHLDRPPNWLPIYSKRYLQNHMIAGRIIKQNGTTAKIPGGYLYSGTYYCSEMIGRIKSEEIM